MELAAGGGAADMEAAAVAALGPLLGGASAPGSVSLAVSSSLNVFRAQKRYSTGLTIAELKCKLELVVGIPASLMDLQLFGLSDEPLGRLEQDEALLGSYPVSDGCRLHVTDRSGSHVGVFEDVSQVPKYEIPDSEYDKRPESLRSFLRQRGWGPFRRRGGRSAAPPSSSRRRRRPPRSPWARAASSASPASPASAAPSCTWDRPTSSRDIGWACATMSPWASTMEAWAAAGISSASPSTEPSSNPRASPPGTSPRRTMGWRTRCEGTRGGTLGTRGGDTGGAALGEDTAQIAVFSRLFWGVCVCVPALSPPPQRCFYPQMSPNRVCVCPPNPPQGPRWALLFAGGGASRFGRAPYCRGVSLRWPRPLRWGATALVTPPTCAGAVLAFATPHPGAGGVASSVTQPMGGRAEEEAGPEAAAGQSRCQRCPRPVSREPPRRGHRRVAAVS